MSLRDTVSRIAADDCPPGCATAIACAEQAFHVFFIPEGSFRINNPLRGEDYVYTIVRAGRNSVNVLELNLIKRDAKLLQTIKIDENLGNPETAASI